MLRVSVAVYSLSPANMFATPVTLDTCPNGAAWGLAVSRRLVQREVLVARNRKSISVNMYIHVTV